MRWFASLNWQASLIVTLCVFLVLGGAWLLVNHWVTLTARRLTRFKYVDHSVVSPKINRAFMKAFGGAK